MRRWQNTLSLACARSPLISRPFTTNWESTHGQLPHVSLSNAIWSEPSLHVLACSVLYQNSHPFSQAAAIPAPLHTSVCEDNVLGYLGTALSQKKYVAQYVVSPIYDRDLAGRLAVTQCFGWSVVL